MARLQRCRGAAHAHQAGYWQRGGHCIDRALLLAGCARAARIPSRQHFATVRHHIYALMISEWKRHYPALRSRAWARAD